MRRRLAPSLVLAFVACGTTAPMAPPTAPGLDATLRPAAILQVLHRAADWQLANPSAHAPTDWTQGAFWAGLLAFAAIAPDPRYQQAARAHAEAQGFRPGPRPGHADDHAILQTYLLLHAEDRDPRQLGPALETFEALARRPHDEPLTWGNGIEERAWSWCDALFMAPPALAAATTATGDRRYLDLMSRLWWKTTDFLYDPEERLFFRDSRYVARREANGRKMFWSRGNGWVLAGLARVLQHVPQTDPTRPRFEALFRAMADRVAALQPSDGAWRASLLDPASHPMPETSGTGFHTYALAWGLNQGLLDRARFDPVVRKAWAALVRAVQPSGKLGYVQRIGDRPKETGPDKTEIYGVGALLLAGSELYRMALLEGARTRVVRLDNPLEDVFRPDELVEVPLDGEERRAVESGQTLVAIDGRSGRFLPTQLERPADGPPRLLVLVSLLPADAKPLVLAAVPPGRPVPPVRPRTFGRFVPERQDDLAWENDRIAFRVYGPALAAAGEISSGIDVWAKRVRRPIVDDWYRSGDYHRDRGTGLDLYKVGASRGCGGLGLLPGDGGPLAVSGNFARWRVLAAGPLRVAFELEYEPWGPPGRRVRERRRVRLDAGQNLNTIEVRLSPERPDGAPLLVAVGIQKRGATGMVARELDAATGGWVSYWEPPQGPDGQVGCAVVLRDRTAALVEDDVHLLVGASVRPDERFVYHAGAAWSGGLDFRDAEGWHDHLRLTARRLAAPVRLVPALPEAAQEGSR